MAAIAHLKYKLLAGLAATALAGGAAAPAQEVIAPDTGALETVEKVIAAGAFGALEVTKSEYPVLLKINQQMAARRGVAYLVEPGDSVELEAVLGRAASQEQRRTLEDAGFFRETNYEEVFWEAEPNDVLIAGKEGAVSWRPGNTEGRASYVTASIARLEADRSARLASSPDVAAPARILAGKSGVLLVPGVTFDRGGEGMLHGQNIGIYPNENSPSAPGSLGGREELYRPPLTFYRIDDRTRDAAITAHQTMSKLAPPVFPEEAGDVRYVAISPRLIKFLKAFEARLEANGLPADKLVILRGFVSPTDRRRLERHEVYLAEFTRFQYGDAIAVVLDPKATEDEMRMKPALGDLDASGSVAIEDAEVLAMIAKEAMDELDIYGGLGIAASYEGPGASKGTPYVHIDLRGWYAPFREE